jgi:hypothetical protein
MNLVDVFIVEILEEPRQCINFGWSVRVMTDCYGRKLEKVFTASTKEGLEKYKVGYKWLE